MRIRTWGGITSSSVETPIFHGWYWDPELPEHEQYWEPDENALIFIDAWGDGVADLLKYLDQIREMTNLAYVEGGEPQRQVWITSHPLQILMR